MSLVDDYSSELPQHPSRLDGVTLRARPALYGVLQGLRKVRGKQ